MRIGVPRERKTLEKRVALTPEGAALLVGSGHVVTMEIGAGEGSGFSDSAYADAGCTLVSSLSAVWQGSDMVVKVKEPHIEEYQYLRPGLIVFDYLHLAGMPRVANALLEGGATGLAYELVQTEDGRLPLLEPMSEIAGTLSILNGCSYLLSQNGGSGILIGGTKSVAPGVVVVLGFGVAGQAATLNAVRLGAKVSIIERKAEKRELAQSLFGDKVSTFDFSVEQVDALCAQADLLIGAVLVPGAAAPKVLTRANISHMKPGSVFVDISVDQGGCSETTKVTSLASPIYVDEGVIHYAVPNMPAQAPRTATLALTRATFPYVQEIADKGLMAALKSNKALRKSVNAHGGKLTSKACGDALNKSWMPIDEALSL